MEHQEQVPPVPNATRPVWDMVIEDATAQLEVLTGTEHGGALREKFLADMRARSDLGVARYGTPLQVGNGRDWLRDAYEEALDLTVYLRQGMAEGGGVDVDVAYHYQVALVLAANLCQMLFGRQRAAS